MIPARLFLWRSLLVRWRGARTSPPDTAVRTRCNNQVRRSMLRNLGSCSTHALRTGARHSRFGLDGAEPKVGVEFGKALGIRPDTTADRVRDANWPTGSGQRSPDKTGHDG